MVSRIPVPRVLHLVDPIAERQRKFPLDQVNQAFLPAAGALSALRVDEILWRAGHTPPVGFANSRKPRLVPGRRDLVQRLIAFVADSPSYVECLVEGGHGFRIMQLVGMFLSF